MKLRAAGRCSRISVFVVCLLCPIDAPGQPRFAKTDTRVPMSDGTQLASDLYLPESGAPFPTIVIRTPYGKDQMKVFAEFFATNGYAVVVQDVRGKWASEGEIVPFVDEQQDGVETLDWIVEQEWSNGDIGMWGSSYLSYCALTVAEAQHPALKTIFSNSGWLNGDKINSPGGALHWMLMLPWTLHEATLKTRSLQNYDLDELFRHVPLKDVMASVGINDPVWENPDTLSVMDVYDCSDIKIPIFHLTGWYDFVHPSALFVYETVRAATSHPQRLLVGPWVHDQLWTPYTQVGDQDLGDESVMGIEQLNGLALTWFDHWLKGAGDEVMTEPPIKLFVLGENKWHTFEEWPPRNVSYEPWFLTSGGNANTRHGDGELIAKPSDETPGLDTFVFDPMDPVPTTGGANFHFFPDRLGIRDQREVEDRDDVLVYTSAPVTEELLVIGPVTAVIHVSTDGKDTDFTAKLVEIREDGYAANIVEGIIRASFRNSRDQADLLEPGRIYELKIDLGATALAIKPNHRIRLEISSSNFPKYDRNPNTGEHPWTAVEYRAAKQTVYHGSEHPSRVVLPVVK
ncbi:MAG: CocE/NonD family hydrolase [Candidatus Latescibacterota bacterium]|nr:MAG: CocE/NonD family hydrolase [Candidatus Latescibacterota bacterium]